MRKRSKCAFLATAMAATTILAAGCGNSASGGQNTADSAERVPIRWLTTGDAAAEAIQDNDRIIEAINEKLGIDLTVEIVPEANTEKVNVAMASGDFPDVVTGAYGTSATQQWIDDGMVIPLNDYMDSFPSMKAWLENYEWSAQNGKYYGMPFITQYSVANTLIVMRQDWLDNLGLEAPRTWDEMVAVAEAFVNEDPDGNGENDTIGILGPANSDYVNGNGGNRYGLDPLFSAFQSYPKYWLKDDSGNVVYGSITEETRTALEKVAGLYADGLIDTEILVRNDSSEPLLAGKVGIFFGPWWCGYTVGDAILAQEADWQAYFTPLAEDGKFYTHMAEPTTKYVVASKKCKNPEAAFKIINYLIEHEQSWVDSGKTNGLSTSDLYPLFNVYDNANEIEVSYDCLKKYLAGEIGIDDVDYSTHKLLKSDMEAITKLKKEPYDDFSLEYWNFEDSDLASTNLPRLVSIMVGDAPLVNEEYVPIYNSYDGRTKTMDSKWANLKKLEEETFAKIITGKVGIDAFDSFVEEWKASGGDEITKEVQEELDAQQ